MLGSTPSTGTMAFKAWLADHPTIAILALFIVALIVFPLDELLFLTAFALAGWLGILLVMILLVVVFLGLRRTRMGQRWWGRAGGTLDGWLR